MPELAAHLVLILREEIENQKRQNMRIEWSDHDTNVISICMLDDNMMCSLYISDRYILIHPYIYDLVSLIDYITLLFF